MTDIKITQADVEVLRVGDPKVKITQADVEVLREVIPCDWFIEDIELRNWP